MFNRKLAVFFIALLTVFAIETRAQVVDGVVAVVGEEVILSSEVEAQVQFFAYQNQLDKRTPGLWRQVLDGLINQKILLTKAKLDSIQVASPEVDEMLVRQMAFYQERLGTEIKVAEYFGKSIAQLKADLREEIRGQLMVRDLQRKRLGTVTVSNEEVVEFYTANKDSMPLVPAAVEISHVLIRPMADSAARASSLARIKDIERRIQAGEDFAKLAQEFSEDPGSAKNGGDLGFVRRGEFVKEFEATAFALKEKELSKIIETIFGYHLIQLLEKKGETIHTRHVLITFDKSKLNDAGAIAKLTAIRDTVVSGKASFAAMARLYSQDEATAQQGGDIVNRQQQTSRLPIESLDAQFKTTVDKMTVGDVSEPVKIQLPGGSDYAYHIVKLKFRADEHRLNLTDDYSQLRALAVQRRQGELYEKWLASLRQEVYWKIKL